MKMKMNTLWTGILGITIGFSASPALPAADDATDFAAEQKQIEEEDAKEKEEREQGIKHKYQRMFLGTVYTQIQGSSQIGPDVVGYFVTNKNDPRPGRSYQMKLVGDNQPLADKIKKMHGKAAKLTGKLRVIGTNGEAKYVVVNAVEELSPTPKVPERRSANGL